MNTKKIISLLMTFLMVFGAVIELGIIPAYAATEEETELGTIGTSTINYFTDKYTSAEAKLKDMELKLEKYGYQIYYEKYTGEVAIKNTETGDVQFTNPYTIASSPASANTKTMLMSQIILSYTDSENTSTMYSYVEAARRSQIKAKNLKNALRVEYSIGRTEARRLVPQYIKKDRFETQIRDHITDPARLHKLDAFYDLMDPFEEGMPIESIKEMNLKFPITKEFAIYVCDEYATDYEMTVLENIIKEFCPNYTYESMEYDHQITGYTALSVAPPVFKMSLEYYLDEDGVSVRLPANGIKFDESLYTLVSFKMLPYMAASNVNNEGYTMIPDGSGALFDYKDIKDRGSDVTISGSVYGIDYAMHNVSDLASAQTMSQPIFGLVEGKKLTDEDGIASTVYSGYVAIIEEGESLGKIYTEHGGGVYHEFNSTYAEFVTRKIDTASAVGTVAVNQNTDFTLISRRKYTGSFRIRYIMLSDKTKKSQMKQTKYYDASYNGMALAYTNYLESKGYITKLANTDNTKKDIPLYINMLGAIDVTERKFTIPVKGKLALTTFDDLKTMTSDLKGAGINNIVYKLTGFYNGGMTATVPYKISVEKVVGGDKGLTDFNKYAEEQGIKTYLDLELGYAAMDANFDGFSYRTDAIKAMDNRYIQKVGYIGSLRTFSSSGMVAIAPSVYEKIFTSSDKYLKKLGVTGVSVDTLGSDLNSDFDKDESYNREESKQQVIETLQKIKENYSIMTSGGNAYAVRYADHVLNVALDSSNYVYASRTIPLFGLVYHGYLNYAGKPTNMASDIRQETLKILENGASPYFLLVYRNADQLKNDPLFSNYYSISYEIWFDEMVKIYDKLNDALSDVMYDTIESHEFIKGERVPTQEEKDKIKKEQAEKLAALQAELDKQAEEELRIKQYERRKELEAAGTYRVGMDLGIEIERKIAVLEDETKEDLDPSDEYFDTKYTSSNGMIVRVKYSSGKTFILNYNNFDVEIPGIEGVIPELGYMIIDADGTVTISEVEGSAE